ncbi:MAG: flavodoxin [Desulfobacterales bacterium]|jgi:flavodoxin I|nr:flavodoxin [Desulfobacteraceae bacterium]MBT4363032.1 flavodoxin [Desulfobacteraceae bacterium]MBT7084589.1 flavodoxin [Desulfobacterales bacterium]MBT7697659.1 flavodoxin [Desulfobacterales bacterium]
MKILITYFSQTGNTEKIAKAIHDEISHDCELKKIDDITPADCTGADLLFVGSPIHAGGLAEQVNKFVSELPESSGGAVAGFVTHAGDIYDKKNFETGLKNLEDGSKSKGYNFLGCYNCQGFLTPELHDMIKQAQNVPDDEWETLINGMKEHPNTEDEVNAKTFAREILGKI